MILFCFNILILKISQKNIGVHFQSSVAVWESETYYKMKTNNLSNATANSIKNKFSEHEVS